MAKRAILQLVVAVLSLMGAVSEPETVSALRLQEDPAVVSFEQEDLDGDGAPDRATILTDYQGDRYQVVVLDQGLDMAWSEDWRVGTDFVNDIWFFQTGSGDQTKLIIRFSHGPEGYLAELYDDFNGNGHVGFQIRDLTSVEIVESSYPTLRMAAHRPWLLPDGRVNYMVSCTVQRPLPVRFMQPQYFQYLPQDGSVSYANEVIDRDSDGYPDYEVGQAFFDAPPGRSAFRSAINVNVSDAPRPDFEGAFFWPYLGYAASENWAVGEIKRRPENLSPPIHVDWQAGQIRGVAPLMPGFGLGDQWVIMTTKPINKNEVNELDWEVWGYYDFTGDTVMDVLFRLLHQPVAPVQIGSRTLNLEQVSYAWHHQDRDTFAWDYELELAGLHEKPSTVVKFQDFAVYTVPYQDLLDHFSQPSDWAYATFVAAESNARQSNEGIWEWGTLEGIQTDILATEGRFVPGAMKAQHWYLRGWEENSPAELYTAIREGLRGEYADLMGPVSLYFSAIDRRLHLARAQRGLWNLGNDRQIQYRNLGGTYLDTWTLLENGEPTKVLYAPPGYLVYQDPASVRLFRADGQETLFTTMPPRNRAEWEELDAKLAAYQADFAPDDFLTMAAELGEPLSVVLDASLRDLRLTEGGFRFVLRLGPGFAVPGEDPLGLGKLDAGEYVATFSEEGFSLEPLTPARVTLEMEVADREDGFKTLQVRITNEGRADLAGVQPAFTQICSGQTQELGGETFDMYGGASEGISVLLPMVAGQACTLHAQMLDREGAVLAVSSLEVTPDNSDRPAGRVLQASSGGGHLGVAYLLLGLIGALFGMLATAMHRRGAL